MKMFTHNIHMLLTSRIFGTNTKIKHGQNGLSECGLRFFIKWLHLALDKFFLNMAKKRQKHEFVQYLWRILRPKLATISNF